MLSEETIEKLTERLVKRIEEVNTYTLLKIGESINKIGTLSPSQAQKLVQIMRYGGDYDKIIKKIKEITKLNIKDIENIFDRVAKEDYMFAKQFYEYRNKKFIPYEENKALQKQVDALKKIAVKDYYNLTKTNVIGFTSKNPINNKVIFKSLEKTYIDALDKAVLSISQGKTTFTDELHNITKTLGKSGLKTVNYKDGRAIRLDSAVRTNMKDALLNLHNEMQITFGKEFDSDGVEISVHANPAIDHERVQGRQFSTKKKENETMSEWDKLQSGLTAKDYKGNTYNLDHDHKNGYRPISTMNCYHYIFNIILGVNNPEYSDKQLSEIIKNNNQGFIYEGKHYTNYEGTQIQRRMETEIRKLKDENIFAKQTKDEDVYNNTRSKIRVLSKKYKEFSQISGLPVKSERMRVSGYNRKVQ